MKKLVCLVVLTFFSFSCSKSDENETQVNVIDPTKVVKVIFFPGALNERHWNFNDNGLLKEITELDGTILQSFVYDTNNNLVNNTIHDIEYSEYPIINNFTYDSNNYIISYNGQKVTYNALLNSYTIHNKDGFSLINTEITLNDEQLIVNEKENYIEEVTYSVQGFKAHYINENMGGYAHNGEGGTSYKYDNKINPLKQALLPICRAMGISNFGNATYKWAIGGYNSSNNVIFDDFDDFDKYEFIYEYNSNNQPLTCTSKIYSSGVLLRTTLTTFYYYQGDVIPN